MKNVVDLEISGHARRRPQVIDRKLARQVLLRAALVALVLGSLLTLVNQTDAIFGSSAIAWLPFALVYLTPFLVVTVSQVLGIRRARVELARPAARFDAESFARTIASHGIPARALALGVLVAVVNTAIVATEVLLSGLGLQAVPVALILQALSLPILFGALSQALAYRRYLATARGSM